MSKVKHKQTPDITQLADLYLHLARMEEAGISNVLAFKILIETGSKLSAKCYQAITYLKSGRSIAESGYQVGIFNQLDRALITVGEISGVNSLIFTSSSRGIMEIKPGILER
ncbi:hypothetical protein AU255_13330 [Methyloprofundus sedimenti]|uniref:Uncharacterized protein n=1 Tax=Methyloprofundus sedimenti TaxID=1420851 RepID=A0A1V8M3M8_9GAMM|nr:hypothetical protein [Methyloprofundus sedimenti]OQK16086.1 hypothetical protein AU255_13330 [Methyloprofundus sedimenti]